MIIENGVAKPYKGWVVYGVHFNRHDTRKQFIAKARLLSSGAVHTSARLESRGCGTDRNKFVTRWWQLASHPNYVPNLSYQVILLSSTILRLPTAHPLRPVLPVLYQQPAFAFIKRPIHAITMQLHNFTSSQLNDEKFDTIRNTSVAIS